MEFRSYVEALRDRVSVVVEFRSCVEALRSLKGWIGILGFRVKRVGQS
jgi:stalled ribosome rescue protein Dom34